jgi:molybdate/tungstate transport system substrate-binding protein
MRTIRAALGTRAAAACAAVTLTVTLTACGQSSSPPATTAAGGTGTTSQAKGAASVAVAGSIDKLYNTILGPAFKQATGDGFGGPPSAGSKALAQEILADEISPGAFLSVGAKSIKLLWPTRTKFALVLGTDPLVVAYSPHSRYAAQLNAIRSGKSPLKDLFSLFEKPGFRLGRTDPNQDPQGQFFELMIKLARSVEKLPSDTTSKILGNLATTSIGNTSQVFAETSLPAMIASGNVDAGASYLPEAKQYHLSYITLPPTLNFADPAESSLYATVSITLTGDIVVPGDLVTLDVTLVQPKSGAAGPSAANQAADDAFVAFVLSATGRSLLQSSGYTLGPPKLKLAPGTTSASAVLPPAALALYDKLGGSISTS